jgi:hypothetical protein
MGQLFAGKAEFIMSLSIWNHLLGFLQASVGLSIGLFIHTRNSDLCWGTQVKVA